MKNILVAIICFIFIQASGQDSKAKFDGKNWDAPYVLDMPKGWDIERFPIPIEFAPSIPYQGVEDIRFTPGWAKRESEEYWTYAFLWYLNKAQKFEARTIEDNLLAYYTGLIKINTDKSDTSTLLTPQVRTSIRKLATVHGDQETFSGNVNMFDYMSRKPITLNLFIHVKSCRGQDKTFVFYQVSPKPYTDPVWKSLNQLWFRFKCEKG